MEYSKYQLGVFDFVEHGSGNGVVDAVAGSGKTTTSIHSLKYLSPQALSTFFAFGVRIVQDIKDKMPGNTTAQTLNSFGWQICLANSMMGFIKFNENKVKNILQYEIFGDDVIKTDEKQRKLFYSVLPSIKRLVSLGRGHNLQSCDALEQNMNMLCDKFDIFHPYTDDKFDYKSVLMDVYQRTINKITVMDYDDQLFQPVYRNYPFPKFTHAYVDESQDLNPIQIEMMHRLPDSCRKFFVGDPYQAIFGFRGADIDAISRIREEFGATVLPLSICYRCPKKVVMKAQKIVNHIEYWENAPEGIVDGYPEKNLMMNAYQSDYVLCRTTAPLVTQCLSFIRSGKKALVVGRDIGESLCILLDKFGPDHRDVDSVIPDLLAYGEMQGKRLEEMGKETELQNLKDRIDTLMVIMEDCVSVFEVKKKIDSIFTDGSDKSAVMFSTIHKAKGLEADRIHIIRPDLLPHPAAKQEWQKKQEKNLEYVAITRARKELYEVTR